MVGSTNAEQNNAALTAESKADHLLIKLSGHLSSSTTGTVWHKAMDAVEKNASDRIVLNASDVTYCDTAGAALLEALRRRQDASGGTFEIHGLRDAFQQLLDLHTPEATEKAAKEEPSENVLEGLGRTAFNSVQFLKSFVSFTGELSVSFVYVLRNPGGIRWQDALFVSEKAGTDALPVVALISFLVGLIIAFQSAIPLGQFGADVFVANLVGLSIIRELGPLMTAVILAGRSGSAFAAELGTMKVNEEIDALLTMGLDPFRFLVVTRVLAAMVMTPLLTVFADLVGVLGGSVIFVSLGHPLVTYFNQILSQVTYVDFLGGLLKSIVFGILIAGVGCLSGLQTKISARGVGESTTRAVVSAIILIVVADGIFAVVYYYLGI